jgi:F0F1-type ATP synthase assembly protein I
VPGDDDSNNKNVSNDKNNNDRQQRTSFSAMMAQAARYSELAFIIPAGIFAGWLAGLGLESWLHRHWLVLAGVLLGVVAGFVEMIRRVLQLSK